MTQRVRSYVLACAAAAALGITGCNGEDETAPAPQPPAVQQQQQAPQREVAPQSPPPGQFDNMPGAQPTKPSGQDTPGSTGEPSTPPATETPSAPEPQGRASTPPPAARQQPPAPTARGGATANTPEAKARALIERLQAQKSENKWVEGEKTIQELEKLKGSLPPEMRDEVDNERASFRMAKQIFNQDR